MANTVSSTPTAGTRRTDKSRLAQPAELFPVLDGATSGPRRTCLSALASLGGPSVCLL